MNELFKYSLIVIGSILLLTALSYYFGWIGVHQTKTIYKAKEDAKREVFEQTQSYVEGKRQEALKLYREYKKSSEEEKKSIEIVVSISFANFDESKLDDPLRTFVHNCKYQDNQ